MLDLDVLVAASRFVAVTTTSRGAAVACGELVDSFTGAELVAAILRVPVATSAQLLATHGDRIPVDQALLRRAAILMNPTGRVGVVVGPMRLVEPCGRKYALTTTTAEWWVDAWWLRPVTATLVPSAL